MSENADPLCLSVVYCTFCGNRRMRHVSTRQEIDVVLRFRRKDFAKFAHDIERSVCAFCAEPMGLQCICEEQKTP